MLEREVKMGRMVTMILGAAVLLGVAWHFTMSTKETTGENFSGASPQTLQHVRETAHRIEDNAQKRADDIFEKTSGADRE
jgi:hypothetical protein